MNTNITPQLIGSNWAVPTVDSTANAQVEIQLSVAVSEEDSLVGSDVSLQAMAGAAALSMLSSPDAGSALPTVQTKAVTAFAIFTFDNPQNLTVTSIVAGVRGQSATFDLSGLVA